MNPLLLALLLAHAPSNVTFCPVGSAVTGIPLQGRAVCSVVGGGGGGAGLPADPAACPANQFVIDQNASGVLTCAQPGWAGIASKPTTFTPAAHTHPGSDVTTAVANATAAVTATTATTAGALSGTPAACTGSNWMKSITSAGVTTCTQPAYSDLTGPPTIPADISGAHYVTTQAEAGLPAEVVLPTCTGTQKLTFNGTAISCGTDQDTLPPSLPLSAANGGLGQAQPTCIAGQHLTCNGTTCSCSADTAVAHSMTSATHSDVDTAAVNADDTFVYNSGWKHIGLGSCSAGGNALTYNTTTHAFGCNTSGFSAAAHSMTSATHSDVDTAAPSTGDIFTWDGSLWRHLAIGGANTLLHGGTNPTYSAVVDADLSGAVGVTHGGLGAAVTPAAGTIPYGSSGTAHAELAAGTAGQVLRSGGAGAPVWVGVQSCTSSASTTCTITVARSGCAPVCMNATAVSTWVRGTVSTTTLTCTFSTSGTNTCNCLCP